MFYTCRVLLNLWQVYFIRSQTNSSFSMNHYKLLLGLHEMLKLVFYQLTLANSLVPFSTAVAPSRSCEHKARDSLRLVSILPNSSRRSSTNLSDVNGVKVVCPVGLPVAVEWHSSRYFTRHTKTHMTLARVSILSRPPWDCGSDLVWVGCVEMIATTRSPVAIQWNRTSHPLLVQVTLDPFVTKTVLSFSSG